MGVGAIGAFGSIHRGGRFQAVQCRAMLAFRILEILFAYVGRNQNLKDLKVASCVWVLGVGPMLEAPRSQVSAPTWGPTVGVSI